MSGQLQVPDIMDELENIFAWNPIAHVYGSPHTANNPPDSSLFPQATFYDMHLAPNRICKKVVHVKDLHRQLTKIVDEKLEAVRDRDIPMESTWFYAQGHARENSTSHG
jgi:hypothetical protein